MPNAPKRDRPRVQFICDQWVKDYLEQWSSIENRSTSNLIETIVLDAIKIRKQALEVEGKSPSTIHELVAVNLPGLKDCGVGALTLTAIAKGEALPTRPDFCKITSALKIPEEEKKRLWEAAYGVSNPDANKSTKSSR